MRSLLLAGALLLSAIPAQAEQVRVTCGNADNYTWCLTDRVDDDIILLMTPQGGERITVNCDEGVWESYGYNDQQFIQDVVTSFCN